VTQVLLFFCIIEMAMELATPDISFEGRLPAPPIQLSDGLC